jgi:serine O-acetyltransferase
MWRAVPPLVVLPLLCSGASAWLSNWNGITSVRRYLSSNWRGSTKWATDETFSSFSHRQENVDDDEDGESIEKSEEEEKAPEGRHRSPVYDLGIGKNPAVAATNWNVPEPVRKPHRPATHRQQQKPSSGVRREDPMPAGGGSPAGGNINQQYTRVRRMVARDNDSQRLRGALWDELHYSGSSGANETDHGGICEDDDVEVNGYRSSDQDSSIVPSQSTLYGFQAPRRPASFYPDIDLSVPDTVYSRDGSVDLVWDLLRWEAFQQAQREPLLVSYLHSTILNHPSLESSLAFLLANRLQSPGMIATQLQSVIIDALLHSPTFRRNLRADMLAVRDRDPACTCLPDVFLYFKGFHALQSHRVAHYLYHEVSQPYRKVVLAKFLQSQVSQSFQIDIHPNARLGSGIMLDHGTGIVIGETAKVGHNCSILHHVTLGGSGKKGVKRHPTVGDGVLLGAGATVLGDVNIGTGEESEIVA